MLQIGVIEPADGAWSSPVVLAAQEGRADRFCVDFRKVNSVTKSDAFPIPRLEDCIDQVGCAQFVTKVDLLKGYFQVPLTPRARAYLRLRQMRVWERNCHLFGSPS